MPSKSDSARINGAKSRGPVTEAGRARSSKNAIKHGLTAQTIVLPTEDPDEYDALLTSYTQQFQPDGPVELDLVHEMAAAQWRLQRIALIETQLFTAAIEREEEDSDSPLTPVESLTAAFRTLANGTSLGFLHRMESRLGRSYSRALRNLLQLQRLRHSPAAAPASPAPGENKICKNEPTDPASPTGYINAPHQSPTEDQHTAGIAPSYLRSARPRPPSLLGNFSRANVKSTAFPLFHKT